MAFLRSGSALQPILPKSQAWCLDEQSSKFVLQIRRPNYWRIEVPVGNEEEIRRALVLRDVLDKILQFEKTPCPFERSFTVALPERPQTPVKKRTWTPPARTVSMNWPPGPPGQPITPPPEFPSRTRFYNPAARRFSDFGADTSKLGLTPATSPQKYGAQTKEEPEKPVTPSRQSRRLEESEISCEPLMEEPETETLSPPPTAIPTSIAQMTGLSSSQSSMAPLSGSNNRPLQTSEILAEAKTVTTHIPVRKREPIWITKQVPAGAPRKAKKPAVNDVAHNDSFSPLAGPTRADTSLTQEAEEEPGRSKVSENVDVSSKDDSPNETSDECEAEGGSLSGSGQLRVRRTRVAAFASRRAAAAPSLKLRTSSASTVDSVEAPVSEPEKVMPAQPISPTESTDSFFSMESWHSPISPAASPTFSPSKTYPYPHENIPLNKGQLSAFTTTPTVSGWDKSSIGAVVGSGAQTPNTPFTDTHDEDLERATVDKAGAKLDGDVTEPAAMPNNSAISPAKDDEVVSNADTDPLSTSWSSAASHASSLSHAPIRHRAATTSVAISHRSPRALSPLPPAANLLTVDLSNRASSTARAIRRIPSSIFNKTCEILISPPAHLISLMLKVAERITAGEWRGFTFGMGEDGEVLDVRWDWSDDGELLEGWGLEGPDMGLARPAGLESRRRSMVNFGASELMRAGSITTNKPVPVSSGYKDPWATPPEEPDMDEGEHWSRSWGVD